MSEGESRRSEDRSEERGRLQTSVMRGKEFPDVEPELVSIVTLEGDTRAVSDAVEEGFGCSD